MMGNSSGGAALQNRTAVGLRALTTSTPAQGKKIAKKGGVEQKALDRVDRDEERKNPLFDQLEEQVEEQTGLSQPPGHGETMRLWPGEAFRSDKRGKFLDPVYGDVDQGNLSDTWLMASCAAVAHAQPNALLSRVRRRDERSFVVTLGREDIILFPDFPLEGYAEPNPNGQADTLWVALVEKAFALHEAASYAHLETGNAGRALELLTGKKSLRTSLGDHLGPERIWKKLLAGQKNGAAMVLKTREAGVQSPLLADHCYAVLEIKTKERQVVLYNPWGTNQGQRPLESMVHAVGVEFLLTEGEALFING